ncbi:hypothetical protein P154DRAFT_623178 [Amniculicola lignicola CBS 123094]|uniref:VWFA domain-containing protein n=1 Tax=Amniculicola lignicola CBS 123094 TaxID=1392246 RepID=A0A6A5WBR4_9PLEO|nr:hypothetical protein P154DRAFT_623178 [Amniculicola lignicola CBS 123094]
MDRTTPASKATPHVRPKKPRKRKDDEVPLSLDPQLQMRVAAPPEQTSTPSPETAAKMPADNTVMHIHIQKLEREVIALCSLVAAEKKSHRGTEHSLTDSLARTQALEESKVILEGELLEAKHGLEASQSENCDSLRNLTESTARNLELEENIQILEGALITQRAKFAELSVTLEETTEMYINAKSQVSEISSRLQELVAEHALQSDENEDNLRTARKALAEKEDELVAKVAELRKALDDNKVLQESISGITESTHSSELKHLALVSELRSQLSRHEIKKARVIQIIESLEKSLEDFEAERVSSSTSLLIWDQEIDKETFNEKYTRGLAESSAYLLAAEKLENDMEIWMRRLCNMFVRVETIAVAAIKCFLDGAVLEHHKALQQLDGTQRELTDRREEIKRLERGALSRSNRCEELEKELDSAKKDLGRLEDKSRQIATKEAAKHETELGRAQAALNKSVAEVAHLKQLREHDREEREMEQHKSNVKYESLLRHVDDIKRKDQTNQREHKEFVDGLQRALETASQEIIKVKDIRDRELKTLHNENASRTAFYEEKLENLRRQNQRLRLEHEKEIEQQARAHEKQLYAEPLKQGSYGLAKEVDTKAPWDEAVLFSIDLSSSVGSNYSAMVSLYKGIVSAIRTRNTSARIAVICHGHKGGPILMEVLQPFKPITSATELLLDNIPLGTSFERHDAMIVQACAMIQDLPPRYKCRLVMLGDDGFFASHYDLYADLATKSVPIYVVQFGNPVISDQFTRITKPSGAWSPGFAYAFAAFNRSFYNRFPFNRSAFVSLSTSLLLLSTSLRFPFNRSVFVSHRSLFIFLLSPSASLRFPFVSNRSSFISSFLSAKLWPKACSQAEEK